MTKEHVLDEIRRTAAENRGKPLGVARFEQQTGIRYHDWFGKFWKNWGQALQEAGFPPNTLKGRIAEEVLFELYVRLVRDLGRVPVKGDLMLQRRADPAFPSDKVFTRCFGPKSQLLARIRELCVARGGFDDVVALLSVPAAPDHGGDAARTRDTTPSFGFVYLIKSGRFYKVGKTNSVGRRERELAIQLPEKSRRVHSIKTDDPTGIEAYWHARFAEKRAHGEWFKLDAADVDAFKRRKFQ